jgi:membrane-bound serine protease (ClpP class)
LDHLVGQLGRALTPLRPSGLVDFDGRRLDGLSEEGFIPSGSLVRAVRIRGGQLVVRVAPDLTLDEALNQVDPTPSIPGGLS